MFARMLTRFRRLLARLRQSTSLRALITSSMIVLTPMQASAQSMAIRPPIVEVPVVRAPQPVVKAPKPVIKVKPAQVRGLTIPKVQATGSKTQSEARGNYRISDGDIVRMCGDTKDQKTIEAVVRVRMALARFATKVSKKASAEDISQEAVTRIIANCDKVLSGYYKHPVAVAQTTTLNLVYSEARSGWVVYRTNADGGRIIDTHHDRSPTPSEALEIKDLAQKLEERLTTRERQVMEGLVDNKSYAQIARELVISQTRVKQVHKQIRDKVIRLSEIDGNK